MALRQMLRGKIHRVTVTQADLDYVGSLTVDADLLRAADILPYELVLVVNLANGARLETYAIEGAAGSGVICANGAAAHSHKRASPALMILLMPPRSSPGMGTVYYAGPARPALAAAGGAVPPIAPGAS